MVAYDAAGANPEVVWNNGNLPVGSGSVSLSLGGTTTDPSSVTYAERTCYYYRVGRMVFIMLRLATSAVTGGSGNIVIRGLPYSISDANVVFSMRTSNLPLLTSDSSDPPTMLPLYAYGVNGSATIQIARQRSNNTPQVVALSEWGSNGDVYISGVYRAPA